MSSDFKPRKDHQSLGPCFFAPVKPASFPKHILRFRNQAWAERLGLGSLSDEAWCNHFGRFEPLPGSLEEPLALAYHGHQFRSYNPDLGDGRGFLFAQLEDPETGHLLDLGTKGSGQTPWSRSADGRLTLKGAVREILATEYLEALGVNTSKTFSVIETGEELDRHDEPSPTRSAVMVRLSHSHIRIGSFQRLAALARKDDIETLLFYAVEHYYPEIDAKAPLKDVILSFLKKIVENTATTTADWMAAGFVHGVLNTDNINITGESFDYGPWRFLPKADPGFTAAYFDQTGLYAYARQPETLLWNVSRLAECFTSFVDVSDLQPLVEHFAPFYGEALNRAFARRLGLTQEDATRLDLASQLLPALSAAETPFEDFFFSHFGGSKRNRAFTTDHEDLRTLSEAIRACTPDTGARIDSAYLQGDGPETMLIDEVEALWDHIDQRDDWQPLMTKIERLRSIGNLYKD